MKKIIFAFAGIFAYMLQANGVGAQNSFNEKLNKAGYRFDIAKATDTSSKTSHSLATINIKAVRNFVKNYKDINDEQWSITNEGYVVRFKQDGKNILVHYDKKGNWQGVVKGYTQDKLPFEVRDMVRRNYYDSEITYVDEVETIQSNGKPVYIVHIADKSTFQLIRIFDGEMSVWESFQTQQ
ncbi:MAG: hypothetical protein QM802_13750 [Agriterribacter sp.]